jgi:methionyl aminopeptidase
MIGTNPWQKKFKYLPIDSQYSVFPKGEMINIKHNKFHDIEKLRKAAIIHKQVRYWIQKEIKVGCDLFEIVKKIETITKMLANDQGLNGGIGFPCGVSKDDCAAHYSPCKPMILNEKSVYKLDFGTHVDGYIIDSAFSVTFNSELENLLKASYDATMTGIKMAGVDQIIGEWGEAVQEVMESYEVEINGKTYQVKPVRNLGGHNILPYKIHGGQLLLGIKNDNQSRMMNNTIYAIETFASTGDGWTNVREEECNLYALNASNSYPHLKFQSSKDVLREINTNYKTLPLVDRWFNNISGYKTGIKELSNTGYLFRYTPLYDCKGSYTSQYEHTIFLTENGKENLSHGDDY